MSSKFFQKLVGDLDSKKKCRVVIPLAQDEACAFAVCHGIKLGLISAKLIGDPVKITAIYGDAVKHSETTIMEEVNSEKACKLAVKSVRDGDADIIMKGLIPTSSILKAVLNTKDGLKKNPLLSHLTFFETGNIPGMKILSDAAINIAPDAETLAKMIDNAVEAFKLFSSRPPLVALLAANEKVSDKVPSTVLAKNVAQMFEKRNDVVVEGPVSLDLAVSPESAKIKKYSGKIQGNADIFIVPRIEAGNVLYKSLQYFTKTDMGGLVYGAKCPVVLTSRADDNDTKFNSLLLGAVLWQREAGRSFKALSEVEK